MQKSQRAEASLRMRTQQGMVLLGRASQTDGGHLLLCHGPQVGSYSIWWLH
jgi:hypothetical protein